MSYETMAICIPSMSYETMTIFISSLSYDTTTIDYLYPFDEL